MGYSNKRYAKFSITERVLDIRNNCEVEIEQTHLDLLNDMWTYRLKGQPGWVNQDMLMPLPTVEQAPIV